MAKQVTVRSYTRRSSTGKVTQVKQHSRVVDYITGTNVGHKVESRVDDQMLAQDIKAKYARQPMNIKLMVDSKWKTVDRDITIRDKKGNKIKAEKQVKVWDVTPAEMNAYVKQNEGLARSLVNKLVYNYNPETNADYLQAAREAMIEVANEYHQVYNPQSPADVFKRMYSRMVSKITLEREYQNLLRFSIPRHKMRLLNKFRQLREIHGSDYDAIYKEMKLKVKDLYPSASDDIRENPLPKDNYVTPVKKDVAAKHTKAYNHRINEAKDWRENEYSILKDRASQESSDEFGKEMELFDKDIERLTNKWMKLPVGVEKQDAKKKVDAAKVAKRRYEQSFSPITAEDQKKEAERIEAQYQQKLRNAKNIYDKVMGQTTLMGANALFTELDAIMSFRSVNVSASRDTEDGEKLPMEEIVGTEQMDASEQMEVKFEYKQGIDILQAALDTFRPTTAKIMRMRLGLAEENELYAHGLWGVPMKVSEIVDKLPSDFFKKKSVNAQTIENWRARKPQRYERVRVLTPKQLATEIKKYDRRRANAKVNASIAAAAAKTKEAKAEARLKVYTKAKARPEDKPVAFVEKRIPKATYEARLKEWNDSKPKSYYQRTERFAMVRQEIEYAKRALRRTVPKEGVDKLLNAYRSMRRYSIAPSPDMTQAIRKSLIMEHTFNVTYADIKKSEDGWIAKMWNSLKRLVR